MSIHWFGETNLLPLLVCGSVLLVPLFHRLLRKFLVDRQTAVNDLPLLGKPRPSNERLRGTAIIAGGSIAGLLAARVCSDHFESVLLVEPESGLGRYNYETFIGDLDSDDSELPKRSRVLQYNAAHGYQVFTLRALRELFPHFEDSLSAWGGRILPSDLQLHISGRPVAPPAALTESNKTMFASRHLYESILRALVTRACKNVSFITGSVTGIVPSSDSSSARRNYLSGVKIRVDSNTDAVYDATLLVDCTGAAQAGIGWLEKAGCGQFADLRVSYDVRFRGTTCHFLVPEGMYDNLGAIFLYIPDPRRDIRNFYIQRVERDRLQVVCAGYGLTDQISSFEDVSTFISHTAPAVSLPLHIHNLPATLRDSGANLRGCQSFRLSKFSFVRYDQAPRGTLPHNFVALGDALCFTNPMNGQGATLAAVGAVTLNAALAAVPRTLPDGFSTKFFKRLTSRIFGIWEANKSNDYGFPTTERSPSDGPRHGAFHRRYMALLAEVASRDSYVAETIWEVLNFLAPGTDMVSPLILCRVLWNVVVGRWLY